MKTIKIGSKGIDVRELCKLLEITEEDIFDCCIEKKVIEFQKTNNLSADGIVGPKTWFHLFIKDRLKKYSTGDIIDYDYEWAGKYLDCESAAIKAVVKVETGDNEGFIAPGKPKILFEGHIFWSQLKKVGIDPEKLQKDHPGIIYQRWDKSKYLGGIKEYERFNEACEIDKDAAICSTSFGLFQIMGFNHDICSVDSPEEFYNLMCESEFRQLTLGLEFIRNNNLVKYIVKKDWAGFAKRYNGSGYKQNQYDIKLEKAYKEYSV